MIQSGTNILDSLMRSSFDSGMVYMVFFNVIILVAERIIYLQNPVESGDQYKKHK